MFRFVDRGYPDPMKTLVTPTPPLGWNSWDCYGASVREDEVLANAEYLAKTLKPFGWDTVVVDIQWAEPTADSSRYHAYAEYADLWRITDDFWDKWGLLKDMFDRCERWYSHVGPGSWPDCDMLPLGHIGLRSVDGGGEDRMTRFTRDEQVTMMTLWCLFRSPLMFGGELRDNDAWTNSLLTNLGVLQMHREGSGPRPVTVGGDHRVWTSQGVDGLYVALFNLTDADARVGVCWAALGISGPMKVRDLWSGTEVGWFSENWSADLPPHGCRLGLLTRDGPQPGVNSSGIRR